MHGLDDLLRFCTVRLSSDEAHAQGTGFFIAPDWILTCAHVVEQDRQQGAL